MGARGQAESSEGQEHAGGGDASLRWKRLLVPCSPRLSSDPAFQLKGQKCRKETQGHVWGRARSVLLRL